MNKFIMLVGPAGSGKSTVAANMCEQDEYTVVSSDSIREELFGDESVQGDPSEIFSLCRTRCIDALKEGKNVILDATNLNRKKRKSFLNDVKNRVATEFKSECIVVAVTYEDCLEQNAQRERQVPEKVIYKQFCQFQMPLYSEEWNNISVVSNSTVSLQEMLEKCRELKHDNSHHKYDVYQHISQTEFWIMSHSNCGFLDDYILRHVALWHDIGKFYTKVFKNKDGEETEEAHFYNHESWSTMYCLCDPTYPMETKVKIAQLVSLHMMKYQPEYDTFVEKWCPEFKDLLDIFNQADAESA